MPTVKQPQLTSFSYSRWADYKQCPLRAKLKHLDKIKEPGNKAMDRGTAIHQLAEDYVLRRLKRLPAELKLFAEEFKFLRSIKAPAEEQWTFDKKWGAVEWNDWNRAWLRIKVDAHFIEDATVTVVDYKTGKISPYRAEGYGEQLELTAAAAFQRLPQVEVVRTQLWYLDAGQIYPEDPADATYERARDAKRIIKIWEQNGAKMLNATKFPAKPGRSCQWCHYRASNTAAGGGQCKHG